MLKLLIDLDNKHYDLSKPLSYSDLFTYIIKGGRGIGKTTMILSHFLKRYDKYDEEFILLRRYETELSKAKKSINGLINGVNLIGCGKGAVEMQLNKKRLGYCLALTKQQTFKSGLDFSKVKYILFDEAFILSGSNYRYLKNEVVQFLELISTVFRARNDYKIFIVGNNMDLFDPYTTYFDLPILDSKGIYTDNERGIYLEYAKSKKELLEIERKTPLYRLTKNTSYNDYHYENKALTLHKCKIGVKEPKAYFYTRIVYENITLTLYLQGKNINNMFVEIQEKIIKDKYTFIFIENGKYNYEHIKQFKASKIPHTLSIYYYDNTMIFENEKANAIMDKIIKEFVN